MVSVRMKRAPDLDTPDPTDEDVLDLMDQITQDEGEPLIVLEYRCSPDAVPGTVSQLWISVLHECDSEAPSGWLVDYYSDRKGKSSQLLARERPTRDAFSTYEHFGALEDI